MPDLELSITICSWNTLEDTRACLQSLEQRRDEAAFEVIVIDNNSEDGSPDMISKEFSWVRLQALQQNLGFTGGQNLALSMRQAPHALLLNSDTVVHPGALRTMLDFIAVPTEPPVGLLGPKLLNPDGSLQYSCRRFPHPLAALFRNTPLGKLFPNNRFTREYLMQDLSHDQATDVDWLSGAALIATETMLKTVGVLDPEFFMYMEDVDYAWRAHEHKLRVVYLPTAVITHAIGRSTDKAPNRMIGRFHKSMLMFYRKNMLPRVWAPLRPFSYVGSAIAIGLRAGMFITKNKIDVIRRWLGR